ncbi:MAG: hypothetical protein AAF587_08245 [Bacteroidota bacterium]
MKRILILCSCFLLVAVLSAQSTTSKNESSTSESIDQTIKQAEEGLNRLLNKFGKKKKDTPANTSKDDNASATSSSSADEAMESSPQVGQNEEIYEPVDTPTQPNSPESKGRTNAPPLEDVPPFPEQDFGNKPYTEKGVVGKGAFGTKSAYWIKESHVTHESTNMNIHQYDTLTFDHFGRFQHLKSFHTQQISMFGFNQNQKKRTLSWTIGDSIFSYNPPERRGIRMANPATAFYEGITEEQAEKLSNDMADATNTTLKRKGTDEVAGKLCEVWESETKNEDGIVMARSRMWYWRGIVLKSHSIGMGVEEKTITTTILPKNGVNSTTFQLPNTIKFNALAIPNY